MSAADEAHMAPRRGRGCHQGMREAGAHILRWDGGDAGRGVDVRYVSVPAVSRDQMETRKSLLLAEGRYSPFTTDTRRSCGSPLRHRLQQVAESVDNGGRTHSWKRWCTERRSPACARGVAMLRSGRIFPHPSTQRLSFSRPSRATVAGPLAQ